jgi:hypothetical protein
MREWRKEQDQDWLTYNDYVKTLKFIYGLSEEKFTEMWNKQGGGICLGCDMKLVTSVFLQERKQYENNPNLLINVDYAIAYVDHDHRFDIEGKRGCYHRPESVRGLLCPSCNSYDVLDQDSDHYIYGDDGDLKKKQLVMDREFNKQASKIKKVG